MATQSPVPCRLSILMAREVHAAVILRRGPSRWVELILWDTKKDLFQRGQWFHGRVYEECCDLSPDGTKFIYFASKYGRKRDADMPDTWTAISKPPYLTALALWPSYGVYGGGRFLDNRRFRRTDSWEKLHPRFSLRGLVDVSGDIADAISEKNFSNDPIRQRLIQTGWEAVVYQGASRLKWKKENPIGKGELLVNLSTAPPGYFLAMANKRVEPQAFEADWADWDQRGRLVVVQAGRLLVGKYNRHRSLYFEELAHFNGDRPESIEAPEWARRW